MAEPHTVARSWVLSPPLPCERAGPLAAPPAVHRPPPLPFSFRLSRRDDAPPLLLSPVVRHPTITATVTSPRRSTAAAGALVAVLSTPANANEGRLAARRIVTGTEEDPLSRYAASIVVPSGPIAADVLVESTDAALTPDNRAQPCWTPPVGTTAVVNPPTVYHRGDQYPILFVKHLTDTFFRSLLPPLPPDISKRKVFAAKPDNPAVVDRRAQAVPYRNPHVLGLKDMDDAWSREQLDMDRMHAVSPRERGELMEETKPSPFRLQPFDRSQLIPKTSVPNVVPVRESPAVRLSSDCSERLTSLALPGRRKDQRGRVHVARLLPTDVYAPIGLGKLLETIDDGRILADTSTREAATQRAADVQISRHVRDAIDQHLLRQSGAPPAVAASQRRLTSSPPRLRKEWPDAPLEVPRGDQRENSTHARAASNPLLNSSIIVSSAGRGGVVGRPQQSTADGNDSSFSGGANAAATSNAVVGISKRQRLLASTRAVGLLKRPPDQ